MEVKGNKIIIRTKKPSDAENDYRWQTDAELSELDAVIPLEMTFKKFYREYIDWLKHPYPYRVTFGIDTLEGKHIGNCVYYNIDKTENETEIGIMIGEREYWNCGYGADAINTMIDYIFNDLGLNRVYLKTLETNIRAQKCFQKCGLKPFGRREQNGYRFLLMDISFSEWQKSGNNKSGWNFLKSGMD
jgi:RimJ/RimL family protein N-acetyltransferase